MPLAVGPATRTLYMLAQSGIEESANEICFCFFARILHYSTSTTLFSRDGVELRWRSMRSIFHLSLYLSLSPIFSLQNFAGMNFSFCWESRELMISRSFALCPERKSAAKTKNFRQFFMLFCTRSLQWLIPCARTHSVCMCVLRCVHKYVGRQ